MDRKRVLVATLIALVIVVTASIFLYKAYRLLNQPRTSTREIGRLVPTAPVVQDTSTQEQISDLPLPPAPQKNIQSDHPRFGTEEWYALSYQEQMEDMKKMSVKDKGEYSRFSYFPDKLTLSGTYTKTISDKEDDMQMRLVNPGLLMFSVDEQERRKLPDEVDEIERNLSFFNSEEAEKAFNTEKYPFAEKSEYCVLSGKATVEMSDFIIDNFEGGGAPLSYRVSVLFQKVISKEKPKITCQP